MSGWIRGRSWRWRGHNIRLGRRASHSVIGATIALLRWAPHLTSRTILRLTRRGVRHQEPEQQRNQQQQSQETATSNDASEVSRPGLVEVATVADIPVSRLLDVLSTTVARVAHRTTAAAARNAACTRATFSTARSSARSTSGATSHSATSSSVALGGTSRLICHRGCAGVHGCHAEQAWPRLIKKLEPKWLRSVRG